MRYCLIYTSLICSFFLNIQAIGQNFNAAVDSTSTSKLDSLATHLEKVYFEGKYTEVISGMPAALALAKKQNDYDKEFILNSFLGNTFLKIHDTIQARAIFKSILQNSEDRNEPRHIVGIGIDLGNTYVTSDPERALEYYTKVLPIAEAENDLSRTFILRYNLAELYLNWDKPLKAKKDLDKALEISKDLNLEMYSSSTLMLFGRYYLQTGKIDKAIANFKESTSRAKTINFKELLLENYKYHIEALSKNKEYKAIYEIRQEYDPIRDEIYEADKIAQLEGAKAKFNISQYEQTIKATDLEKEFAQQKARDSRIFSYYAVALILALLLTLFSFFASLRKRKKLLVNLRKKNRQYLIAKEKSERLTKSKSRFFSTVSHELRTPLYGIIGLSSSLLKENKEEALNQDIKSLKFSADYLLALINDVLFLNKLEEQEGKKLENKTLDIRKLIDNIVNSFEFMKEQNNNEIAIEVARDIPEIVLGDATKLSQILMNLIGNACKFTEEGILTIVVNEVSSSDNQTTLEFIVKDNGIGIPRDKQQQIFEEFTQISEDNKYQGTGLGLSIVNKILDLHNSRLRFESELGRGSTFWFSINYALPESNFQAAASALLENPDILKGKHVLVVDDNRINQIVSQKIIENNQMTSDTASNGFQAIECVQKRKYDIILMDINMPQMNGFEASKKIRDLGINTPIIALTAVNKEKNKQELYNHGINDIIVKPYEINHFKYILSQNLSSNNKRTSTQ